MLVLQMILNTSNSDVIERAPLALGFIMLTGHLLGHIANRFNLPRITGYLIGGVIAGPYIAKIFPELFFFHGFLQVDVVNQLSTVDKLALTLIAFTAGGECRIESIKKSIKSILIIAISHMTLVVSIVAGFLFLISSYMNIFDGMNSFHCFLVCLLIGVISSANSPASIIAIIVETKSKGRLTELAIGVTVLKDILVIILFTISVSLIMPILAPGHGDAKSIMILLRELLMSIIVGIGIGYGIIFYLKSFEKQRTVFIFILSLIILAMSDYLHLEFLLVAIVAGFVIENFSKQGIHFIHSIERASTPVFLVFFAITGAGLHLDSLIKLWPIALAIFAIRIMAVILATWLSNTITKEDDKIKKYSWTAFLAQAGVSLGFAKLVGAAFPDETFGAQLEGIIIGAIVLNEIAGPIIFKWGLTKSGEATVLDSTGGGH